MGWREENKNDETHKVELNTDTPLLSTHKIIGIGIPFFVYKTLFFLLTVFISDEHEREIPLFRKHNGPCESPESILSNATLNPDCTGVPETFGRAPVSSGGEG